MHFHEDRAVYLFYHSHLNILPDHDRYTAKEIDEAWKETDNGDRLQYAIEAARRRFVADNMDANGYIDYKDDRIPKQRFAEASLVSLKAAGDFVAERGRTLMEKYQDNRYFVEKGLVEDGTLNMTVGRTLEAEWVTMDDETREGYMRSARTFVFEVHYGNVSLLFDQSYK